MKKQRKEELKHDEFADSLLWMWETVRLHQREIVTGAVVALVLISGVLYLLNRRQQAHNVAWASLSAIEDPLAQARYGRNPEEIPKARAEAIEKYRNLAQDYSRYGVAPIALYRAGRLLHEEGKLDEAVDVLDQVIGLRPDGSLAAAAESAKAAALEDKGKYAEAKALYEKVGESGPKYLAPECYLNAARCAEFLKDAAQAKSLCEKTIALAPNTEWAQRAEERLKRLAEVPNAPAPKPEPQKKG